ncbi:unnamed protein product, partial [Iphiclides podalirius]
MLPAMSRAKARQRSNAIAFMLLVRTVMMAARDVAFILVFARTQRPASPQHSPVGAESARLAPLATT